VKPLMSVIVSTAPERETYLQNCLELLTRQTQRQFEVMVVDDGSSGGQAIAEAFAASDVFPLDYHWRPNDFCVSRSRNQGIARSQADFLLFLDDDILLNPLAIENYLRHFQTTPLCAIAGHTGSYQSHSADSVLLTGVRVHYLDRRVMRYRRNGLVFTANALQRPYHFSWSANLAVSRQIAEAVGGFDEAFVGWGGEDDQFGLDMIRRGYHLHFALDTWGEQQVHPRETGFYRELGQSKSFNNLMWGRVNYTPNMLGDGPATQQLLQAIFDRYIHTDPALPESIRWQMMYPDAVLMTY